MPRARALSWPPRRTSLLLLLFFRLLGLIEAKPQWSNPSEFYSNSYQYQHGFVPQSAFGVNNQYGAQNANFGGFNRPFLTRPGGFVPYGNSFGATVGGTSPGGPTGGTQSAQNAPESDENAALPHSTGPEPHGGSPAGPPPSTGVSSAGPMVGMGSQVGGSVGPNQMPNGMPPGMPANGMSGPMGAMGGQPTMTGMNEMMAGGYGAMAGGANGAAGMTQWPSNQQQQYGMTNNCFGPGCNQGFPNGAAMNPNGYDYPAGGYGTNLGQAAAGGGEDYNSAEESAEIAAGEDIEQQNLRRYAEYLNLINRRYGIGLPGQTASGMPATPPMQPNVANVIANAGGGGGVPVGTGSFNGMGMSGMNGMNGMNGMGGGLDLTGIPEISGMMAGGGNGGFMGGGMNGGIAGGITSSGITNPTANTPAGMGSLMGRFSPQPSMNGFGSGIVGYGSYMPPNVYETSNYPVQWPMGGGLTNIAGTGSNLGYGMENYGPTGAMPADYLGMGTMGMTPMPAPTPYGYSGVNYPMAPSVYPPNVMPQIYQPVTAATGPPTTPPELSSKSREKSSQESSATSHEHLQASQSPPPATSIQALTQQIRRLPAVLYVDSKDGEGRHVENLLRDTYGLPLVSFYVDKIDKPKVVEKYLHQLTAHKGMPYLFICGTFIGSQEHIENYHKQKQIPQLVEYVCGEEKDKKTGHRQSSHKESTKKRKSSGRHKSRRPSKFPSSRTSNRR